MAYPMPLIAQEDEQVLASPYMVATIENAPATKGYEFLVMHRVTKIIACEHHSYTAASMCAKGIRCVKNRNKVTYR